MESTMPLTHAKHRLSKDEEFYVELGVCAVVAVALTAIFM